MYPTGKDNFGKLGQFIEEREPRIYSFECGSREMSGLT